MAELGPLTLLLGHDEHVADAPALYEPARQARHVDPTGLYEPAAHCVHSSDAPVPLVDQPGKHAHVVAPMLLTDPLVQLVQAVAPADALNVLARQALHCSVAPVPVPK